MPPSVAPTQLLNNSAQAIKELLRTVRVSRFWTGVAQITRSRYHIFLVTLCSIKVFLISSIWRTYHRVGTRPARLSARHGSTRTESSDMATNSHWR